MKTVILLSLLMFYPLLFAKNSHEPVELPDYSIFMDAQFKCDGSNLNKLTWDKRYGRNTTMMAYKTWSILSDLSIKEEKRKDKGDNLRHRDFVLKYTGHAILFCGQEPYIAENPKGDYFITLPVIRDAFRRLGFIDIVSDDEPPYKDINYLYYIEHTDSPNEQGMEGLSCLVKLDDFLKNPLASIDFKKLCKGESKKKIEFTKKEILRVAEILKTRMKKNKYVHTEGNDSKNNK